jgi:uncharacterized RDD family membrane protein YckC
MTSSSTPGSPFDDESPDASAAAEKADVAARFLAMLIDAVVAAALSMVPLIGGVAGTVYYVVRDGLDVEFMQGRSLGKRVMGLRVVRADGQPMDLETSVRRNWMWAIGAMAGVLAYIPILGWILIPFVGLISLAIGLYEGYLVLTTSDGRRWGDQMARTKVVA